MRLIIRYFDGTLQPAIVMAMSGARMRAFVPGCDDSVEFRLADGRWLAENGEVVEMQFGPAGHEFQALVQHAPEACDDRADTLGVYFWSFCVPQPPSVVSVN
jgi:hypothetical protein